jgi:Tfp pilus assembly protein PilN
MKPDMVDIVPTAISNAQKLFCENSLLRGNNNQMVDNQAHQSPYVTLHMGDGVCTLVINGNDCPFYHRNIPFDSEEVFNDKAKEKLAEPTARQLRYFGNEVARSLSFYEKKYQTKGFKALCLMGENIEESEVEKILASNTGLSIKKMDFAALSTGDRPDTPRGRFDLAISLALKGAGIASINNGLYTANMVRQLKEKEKKKQFGRLLKIAVGTFCFGALAVAMIFTSLKILNMEKILGIEREKLKALESQYRKYQATRHIVDKGNIELLDSLQRTRIFWTRKLAAQAMHLPDNYWITKFGYSQGELDVKGFGYISPEQEQLLRLNEYLDNLRADTSFNDKFTKTYFNNTLRDDEGWRERVEFEYSAIARQKAGIVDRRSSRIRRR